MTVQKGDILLIPDPLTCNPLKITVKWFEHHREFFGDYFILIVENKSQEHSNVVLFIASDYYTQPKLETIAKKNGDTYELVVDSSLEYGQKNARGEGRFVVYHDESKHVFQVHFVEAAVGSIHAVSGDCDSDKLLAALGYGAHHDPHGHALRNFSGGPLHTF